MALRLNHYSVRTTDLNASRQFYETVLDMKVGPRPDFPFPGVWMYIGDTTLVENAVVHLIGIDPNDPEGLKKYLGDKDTSSLKGSGAVDHIAFFSEGWALMKPKLQSMAIPFRERTVPAILLHQVFMEDPSGLTVELNYPAHELV